MEPVGAWSPARVARWLRGLDERLQRYPWEAWTLTGQDLLCLSHRSLESLGVRCMGHQELLLEAVEQLCALYYELETTNLRTLTMKLRRVARTIQALVLSSQRVTAYAGDAAEPPALDLLASVVELVGAAKGLFSWLNRYLFTHLHDYSSSRDIIPLCAELAEAVRKDRRVSERGNQVLLICRHVVGICESILSCSPTSLLDRTAVLESVVLDPAPPDDSLGIEIKSTSSGLHFISGTGSESPAEDGRQILPGDELVQVDDQVVVGWTRRNLAKKLLEKPSQVTLVLKRIPLSFLGSPPSQALESFPDAADSSGSKSNDPPSTSVCLPCSVTASQEPGPDSASGTTADGEEGLALHHPEEDAGDLVGHPGASVAESTAVGTDLEGALSPARPSTLALDLGPPGSPGNRSGGRSPGLEPSDQPSQGSPEGRRKQKGVATRLSRRRVSCRDLGRVDCDGWLLKKKDHAGFMAQKWKRCWFVLKGHSLYWYNHPQDEKAAGLINVATYNLESTRELKKKYVFQLSHEKYKPFVFAAETLSDLSMWVSRLIAAKTKYNLAHQSLPHREEDCYSETEAEDPDDDSPRPSSEPPKRRELPRTLERPQPLPAARSSSSSPRPAGSPLGSPSSAAPRSPLGASPPAPSADAANEDLESLIECLKQGGVSLIGRQQFLTHEQYRRSFIKRNANPHINEKVHLVRALQSTLKAKEAELQVLDQLLGDTELTLEKFQTWKKEHQEVYQEIQAWGAHRLGQDEGTAVQLSDEPSPQGAAAALTP
ncbi:PREDICTED: connector enhancer of kinase suppressor of ras 1 isoform X2 [Crocodylus porosus]|uniref:connector enhancer of kinase suppressor of ras 1 isoform X2 n=1 Tax=Crocodylus porosus TaxID=8502 RepID=UPI00093FBBE9|nr:PREDICTED: connector enhancer of kinase suppressor of ras 1 isoform X2 [Crocodylus porosus]